MKVHDVATLMILLSALSIALNTICCYVIARSKTLKRRPTTILLVNLLFVHLVQGFVVFPFYAAKKIDPSSRIACDGFRFTYMVTYYAAVLSVLLIAIDRALATFFVLQFKELVTKQRAVLAILLMWIYVILVCSIPFNSETTRTDTITMVRNGTTYNTTLTKTSTCTYKQTKLWSTLMLLLNCLVPYVLIVLGYQGILRNIQHIELRCRSGTTLSVKDGIVVYAKEIRKNKTVTQLAAILSVGYFILWSPSIIYYNLLHFCPDACFSNGYHDSKAESRVSFWIKYIAYLDALVAPLIYCFFHKEFRDELKTRFKCCGLIKATKEPKNEASSQADCKDFRQSYKNHCYQG